MAGELDDCVRQSQFDEHLQGDHAAERVVIALCGRRQEAADEIDRRQAACELDREALGFDTPAWMDRLVTSLPDARAVRRARDHS